MRRYLTLLLVPFATAAMLVACGPGDGTTPDANGGAALDEPLGGAGDTLGGTTEAPETSLPPTADVPADTGDDLAAGGGAADTPGAGMADTPAAGGEVAGGGAGDAAAPPAAGADVAEEPAAGQDAAETPAADEAAQAEGDQGVAGGGAAPAAGEPVTITLTASDQGVLVQSVAGAADPDSVAQAEDTNPDLNLTVGQRYEIVYQGAGEFVLMNAAGDPLLASGATEGSFAQDADVDFQAQADRISFTLTDALAQELDHYAAGTDLSQEGNIAIQGG